MGKVTIFESKEVLTKKFLKDGTKVSPKFSTGTFKVVDVGSHSTLQKLIESLNHHQALCYSTPFGFDKGNICIKGYEDEQNSKISRTKDYFEYQYDKGWLFIDVDEELTEEEVIKRLSEIYESFGETSYVYATSASHGINGKKGFHLYFKVKDISIVKPAMDNLFNRAFNAGYGKCVISESGSILNRTFFDKAIYDRARLDFISGPICEDFSPPPRDIRVESRANDIIDLEPLLEPVDASKAISRERSRVEPKANAVCQEVAKRSGISLEEYKAIKDGGTLRPGTKLYLEDQSTLDVSEILEKSFQGFLDGQELDPITIQHPIEHNLTEKTRLFYNTDTGVPIIHSFAHGGQKWNLKDDGTVISKINGPKYLIDQLKSLHDQTSNHLEATKYDIHPDTYDVLHLMLKTFIMEYQTDRLLIDQWRDMISLFLHLIDGKKGKYSIELPPSHGKTQVICHIILWLYKKKRIVPISLSVFKIDDIEMIKKWLLERMEKQWRQWNVNDRLEFPFNPTDYLKVRHSEERTPFDDLDKTPVIIHTHHVVRKNDFKENFFSFKGKERDLFIFDEAMFRSFQLSEEIHKSVDHLNHAISRGESGKIKGLPVEWLKAFKGKLIKARWRLENTRTLKEIIIGMPRLSERFVKSGYYLQESEPQNFLLALMNIGASGCGEFRISREKGGQVLFAFKANDISKLPRVVNTDATRSIRRVHEYGGSCFKYPIEPYKGDEKITYWIAPFKNTGKESVGNFPILHLMIMSKWLQEIGYQKVLLIKSKGISLPLSNPKIKQITWGQHKQTNDHRDCDAVVALNYFRKRGYHYKHDIFGELGYVEPLNDGAIKEVEHGFIMDELFQGFCRGTMREGKKQHCLMFSPYSHEESMKLMKALQGNIRDIDEIKIFEYDPVISYHDENYRTDREIQDKIRKVRSDKVYESPQEKEWAKQLRKACRKRGVPNVEELLPMYLRERQNDSSVTPVKWLKSQEESIVIS